MEAKEGGSQQGLGGQIKKAIASGKEKEIIATLKEAAQKLTGSQKGGDFQGGKEKTLKEAIKKLKEDGQASIYLPGRDSLGQDRIEILQDNPNEVRVEIGGTSSKRIKELWQQLS